MTVSAQKRAELTARRRQVAKLYLRKVTQEEIAAKLNVSQPTISRDIYYLGKQWAAAAIGDMDLRRGRELAELGEMEYDCAMQFVSTKGSQWPRLRLQIKERIAKMLGLDASVKVDMTSKGEQIGGITVLSDAELAAEIAELDARIAEIEGAEAGATSGATESGGPDEH